MQIIAYLFLVFLGLSWSSAPLQFSQQMRPDEVHVGDTVYLEISFRWEAGDEKNLLVNEGASQVRGLQLLKRSIKSSTAIEDSKKLQNQKVELQFLALKEGEVDWSPMVFFNLSQGQSQKVEYHAPKLVIQVKKAERNWTPILGGVLILIFLVSGIFIWRRSKTKGQMKEIDLEIELDALGKCIGKSGSAEWASALEKLLLQLEGNVFGQKWDVFLNEKLGDQLGSRWKDLIEQAKFGKPLKNYELREIIAQLRTLNQEEESK